MQQHLLYNFLKNPSFVRVWDIASWGVFGGRSEHGWNSRIKYFWPFPPTLIQRQQVLIKAAENDDWVPWEMVEVKLATEHDTVNSGIAHEYSYISGDYTTLVRKLSSILFNILPIGNLLIVSTISLMKIVYWSLMSLPPKKEFTSIRGIFEILELIYCFRSPERRWLLLRSLCVRAELHPTPL